MSISALSFNQMSNFKNLKANNLNKSINNSNNLSFGKGTYINKKEIGYTSAPVKSSWQYLSSMMKDNIEIENYSARRFTEKLMPELKQMFKDDKITEDKTLFDLIVDRGDDLGKISSDNVTYVNQRYKSALQDYSPKEIAYVMLSKNNKTEAHEILKYLDKKKTLVSQEEYNEMLLNVITGKTEHVNDIPKEKTIAPALEKKIIEASELFTEKSNHKAIEMHIKDFENLGNRKSIAYDFSKEELAFFMTTNLYGVNSKNPQQSVKHVLDRLKTYLPEGIYEQILTESIQGKRKSPNEVINIMQKASSKLAAYRNFDNDQWTKFVIENTKLPQE